MLDERAKLTGKTAVIIGGGGGIGAAITLALAQAGVDVAFCDVDRDCLEPTRVEAARFGVRTFSMLADATESIELERFYKQVGAFSPRLDIVVNVVGGVRRRAFMDATPEDCAADIQRNYGYVIESVRHAVGLMRRSAGGGSIINFTTIEAHRGAATFSVYAGAKAATTNFTRAMAVELGGEQIRLNTIAPDTTPSQGNIKAMSPECFAAMAALPADAASLLMEMYVPMKRPPDAEALANAVLFLASDLATYITGTTLHVDGGTSAAAGFLDWPFGDGQLPVPMANTLSRLVGPARPG